MKQFASIAFLLLSLIVIGQENDLPYYEIPDYSDNYTAGTVAARMVDGLGFRFYWATDGLLDNDLDFRPSKDARTTLETIDHVYQLSQVIVNSTLHKVNEGNVNKIDMSWKKKREQTLLNLKTAADILRNSEDLNNFTIDFKSGQFPFWNNINGPIADAIWHCGQIASFRRSSGNPINPQISHFTGKLRTIPKR